MPSVDEAEPPLPLRQILLPVDGTPNSEVMVDWALENFCREGDQINLLHVIPKCVVHYELPLGSVRPRVRVSTPRTPRLSRGSERDDDTRHPAASPARRYAPSSTMYGFEEYVIDVPDPEQVRRAASSPISKRLFLKPRLPFFSRTKRKRLAPVPRARLTALPRTRPVLPRETRRRREHAGIRVARGRRAVPPT